MTVQHKISTRQVEALVACYCGRRAIERPRSVYGEAHQKAGQPYWGSQTSMGGAARRMVDDLRERGFVTDYGRGEFDDKSHNELTAKGYEALAERLDKLPVIKDIYGKVIYRFAIDRDELQQRLDTRRAIEADRAQRRTQRAELERQNWEQQRAADRQARTAKLRQLFADKGLADNWSDDQLDAFGRQVADVMVAH